MHTKRKQTLLASAGLLTAVTLALAACTPASFKPGPGAGAPTQAQPGNNTNGQAVSYTTIDGVAEVNGVPLKNAEVKVFNALTEQAAVIAVGGGNVIAVGGGNFTQAQTVKTDANGNFSVQVAGLTDSSVARVEVSDGTSAVSAVMTGAGLSTVPGNAAGYSVAQAAVKFNLKLNAATTWQWHALGGVLKLARQVRDGASFNLGEAVKSMQETYNEVDKELKFNPATGKSLTTFGAERSEIMAIANELAIKSNVVSKLEITAFIAAKQAQSLGLKNSVNINKSDFVGVNLEIVITATTIKIGDTVINIDTGKPVTEPSTQPSPQPSVVELPPVEEADENLGHWVINGNITPEVLFEVGDDTVIVKQGANQGQIISMNLILPTGNLSSFPGVSAFMNDLSGNVVTGALTGGVDFAADGRILLNGSRELGRWTAVETGTVLDVTLTYTQADSSVEFTGGYEIHLTSGSTLTSKSGISLALSGTQGSARIKY